MFFIIIVLLLWLLENSSANIDMSLVNGLSKFLGMKHPTIITKNFQRGSIRQSIREESLRIISDASFLRHLNVDQDLIIDDDEFDWADVSGVLQNTELGTSFPAVIVFENSHTSRISNLQFKINQHVYLFNQSSNVLSESYFVGDAKISNPLAKYDSNHKTFYNTDAKLETDVTKRRSNFQGANLKVFVCGQAPYLFINSSLSKDTPTETILVGHADYEVVQPGQMAGMLKDLQVNDYFCNVHLCSADNFL